MGAGDPGGTTWKDRLDAELKVAVGEKDRLEVGGVRMPGSAGEYREIERMEGLDGPGVEGVVASEVKRHRDSVERSRGSREDLVKQKLAGR